ncbi:50S ribosomal protein L1 [Candidatus Marsarchaeota archaeon]|jgi:large subunit ribosomal protein L1|nr:50S ribosomal protein L1 [Candidatus Marsarchaeota archaeon]MCL5099623.1 50S ribosomal protein L1 [Candidatus Marsarchaeota archaeon]
MEKEALEKLEAFINENKGKRKFTQSVELAINFKGIDFNKQDNRLNLQVMLPEGRGKESQAMVFADNKTIAEKAAGLGAKVVTSGELGAIASNKGRMAELLNYELVAEPALMAQIAKVLGQFLGPKNKMPRPLVGVDVANVINTISKSVYIRSKGKYLPTVHCVVGTEKMTAQQLAANIDEVVGSIAKKVGRQNIRSVYVKLTMSAPMKLQ